jgi:1,4-dihydroxy-2-naphthoate polyprenyltransferase
MNPWIQAARLRTLPLALSGILLGAALSHMCVSAAILSDDHLTQALSNSGNPIGLESLKLGFHASPFVMTLLAILTATALQVLSNFANDYGDFSKGTDTKAKIHETGHLVHEPHHFNIGNFINLCLGII